MEGTADAFAIPCSPQRQLLPQLDTADAATLGSIPRSELLKVKLHRGASSSLSLHQIPVPTLGTLYPPAQVCHMQATEQAGGKLQYPGIQQHPLGLHVPSSTGMWLEQPLVSQTPNTASQMPKPFLCHIPLPLTFLHSLRAWCGLGVPCSGQTRSGRIGSVSSCSAADRADHVSQCPAQGFLTQLTCPSPISLSTKASSSPCASTLGTLRTVIGKDSRCSTGKAQKQLCLPPKPRRFLKLSSLFHEGLDLSRSFPAWALLWFRVFPGVGHF